MLNDSGWSSIDILPKRVAESHGIPISPSDTKSVSGFDGESADVLGRVVVQTKMGPEQEPATCLVMNEASRIVLGSPALEKFQFRLNRGERYLETRTAEKVLCNLVRLPRTEWAVRHAREGRSQRRDGFGTALALRAWPAIEEGRDLNCHSVWQTYSLKPPRGQRVLLPWHVRGTRFSLFDSCHIPRVMSSYRYSARSGETNMQLFNTSRHEAVISSKTSAVAVVSPVGFDVRHLNEHSLAGQRESQHAQPPESEMFTVECRASHPLLLSSTKPPMTEKMRDLSVHERDSRIHGELKTEYGSSFDAMRMAGDDVADGATQEYLDAGFFEPVPAVHKSTVMFLSKDQGKRTRLVSDYRKLDAHSEVPPGDLASIGRILRRVPETWTHFCVLDVANGFFSVPLAPSIRHIFGFGFGTDRYQWCVIPRGWCLSSGLFHDRVGRILRDSGALNYVDGAIIGGSSEAEFSANMHDVLERFDEHGIQIIRQRKIRFSSSSVQCLGFDPQPHGRIASTSCIKAGEHDLLTPISTTRDLQSKLGIFDLLHRHVPHSVATKLSPLAECLERKEPFDASRVTDLVTDFRRALYTTTGNSVTRFHLCADWSARGCGCALFFEDAKGRMCLTDFNSVSVPDVIGEFSPWRTADRQVRSGSDASPYRLSPRDTLLRQRGSCGTAFGIRG